MNVRDNEEKDFLKDLGKRVSSLRKENKLTQKKLAHTCDMEPQNIMRIEAGNTNPTSLTLLKLSKALNVEIADLFPKSNTNA